MEARILCENHSGTIGPLQMLKKRKANDSKYGPHMHSNGVAFINVIFLYGATRKLWLAKIGMLRVALKVPCLRWSMNLSDYGRLSNSFQME